MESESALINLIFYQPNVFGVGTTGEHNASKSHIFR